MDINNKLVFERLNSKSSGKNREDTLITLKSVFEGRTVYLGGNKIHGVISQFAIPTEHSKVEDCLFYVTKPDDVPYEKWIMGNRKNFGPILFKEFFQGMETGRDYIFPTENDKQRELVSIDERILVISSLCVFPVTLEIAFILIFCLLSIFLNVIFLAPLGFVSGFLIFHIIRRMLKSYRKLVAEMRTVG